MTKNFKKTQIVFLRPRFLRPAYIALEKAAPHKMLCTAASLGQITMSICKKARIIGRCRSDKADVRALSAPYAMCSFCAHARTRRPSVLRACHRRTGCVSRLRHISHRSPTAVAHTKSPVPRNGAFLRCFVFRLMLWAVVQATPSTQLRRSCRDYIRLLRSHRIPS